MLMIGFKLNGYLNTISIITLFSFQHAFKLNVKTNCTYPCKKYQFVKIKIIKNYLNIIFQFFHIILNVKCFTFKKKKKKK